MADQDANVERVFGVYATLDTGAGSIQKQYVYATDTQQFGVHLEDDSMDWVSSDDKQCLLAGAQDVAGKKDFTVGGANFNDDVNLELGSTAKAKIRYNTSKVSTELLAIGTTPLLLDTDGASGVIRISNNNVNLMQFDSTGIIVPDNKTLALGTSSQTTLSSDGTDFSLAQLSGDISIDANAGTLDLESSGNMALSSDTQIDLKLGVDSIFHIESGLAVVEEDISLKLGNAYVAEGAITASGYVELLDKDDNICYVLTTLTLPT